MAFEANRAGIGSEFGMERGPFLKLAKNEGGADVSPPFEVFALHENEQGSALLKSGMGLTDNGTHTSLLAMGNGIPSHHGGKPSSNATHALGGVLAFAAGTAVALPLLATGVYVAKLMF